MANSEDADTADFSDGADTITTRAPVPFSSLVRLDLGALSHVGRVRSNNEDAYIVYRNGRYWEKLLTNLSDGDIPDRHDETVYVMAVADGMGGMAAGEVASTLSLRTGIHLVLNAVKWTLKLDKPEERDREIDEGIGRALGYIDKMNQALVEKGRRDPSLAGMGTTLTVSYSCGQELLLFHVGDCRAYLFRQGKLRQLTHDQTVAQSFADAGLIAPSEVSKHRLRHCLTQALGAESGRVRTEVHELQLADGDRLLLCSDGLYDLVDDEAIAATLKRDLGSQQTCQTLVDQALERGGKDNVTVLLARYEIPPRAQ